MASRSKPLRDGFTTGACAAAAAKAAALVLLGCEAAAAGRVEIPFPDGVRRSLKIERRRREVRGRAAWVSVIKDAGDDPDVTHGAEIAARVVVMDGRAFGRRIKLLSGAGREWA